jgi:subtilisin family serine protease
MKVLLALALVAVAAAQIIPGEWIVVMKPDVARDAVTRKAHLAKVRSSLKADAMFFDSYIEGSDFAAYGLYLEDEEVPAIRELDGVDFVEPNQMNYVSQGNCQSAAGTSWGVRRVTQWERTADTAVYGAEADGRGTNVYILDTGIMLTHQSFGGRALFGFNAVGGGNGDVHGHGTHCAGTAVGNGFGLARGSSVYNVKVLSDSGSGSTAGIVRGIEWASNHGRNAGGGVLSLSLGGGAQAALDNACNAAYSAGNVVVVAAGNSNANACNFSPARAANVISVASSANNDARSSFSNFGTCTHIFAPGTNILSAGNGGNTQTRTMSGTSMACPHVAGLVAKYWTANPTATAAQVRSAITTTWANPGRITNPGAGSPNRLAYYPCNAGFAGEAENVSAAE